MDSEELDHLNVLKRDKPGYQIDFECPSCQKPVELRPTSLIELEAGNRIVSWCRGCLSSTIVSLASLGGFLWSQE